MEANNSLTKFKTFTLIEIVIAIAILAIGITSVMSLFPLGLHSTKNSIAQNYSAMEAENIYAYLSRTAYDNWNAFETSIPASSKPNSIFNKSNISTWSQIEGNIYDNTNANDGILGLKVQSNNNNDMTGEILLWKEELYNYADPREQIPEAYGVFMEISWPIEKPYKERKKNYYYKELKNPNP